MKNLLFVLLSLALINTVSASETNHVQDVNIELNETISEPCIFEVSISSEVETNFVLQNTGSSDFLVNVESNENAELSKFIITDLTSNIILIDQDIHPQENLMASAIKGKPFGDTLFKRQYFRVGIDNCKC